MGAGIRITGTTLTPVAFRAHLWRLRTAADAIRIVLSDHHYWCGLHRSRPLAGICDTHWPWKSEEVIAPGVLDFTDGAVPVPRSPGLGVELDRDAPRPLVTRSTPASPQREGFPWHGSTGSPSAATSW
ncbi:hypothetical protein [Streptomyces sp. NPDC050560]|uniref:hypothetical protein n=1 Tax=Streptomyces sp. NPDC050560 TaxID=3365630 RepID=UPI003794A19C